MDSWWAARFDWSTSRLTRRAGGVRQDQADGLQEPVKHRPIRQCTKTSEEDDDEEGSKKLTARNRKRITVLSEAFVFGIMCTSLDAGQLWEKKNTWYTMIYLSLAIFISTKSLSNNIKLDMKKAKPKFNPLYMLVRSSTSFNWGLDSNLTSVVYWLTQQYGGGSMLRQRFT